MDLSVALKLGLAALLGGMIVETGNTVREFARKAAEDEGEGPAA